jgi:hypothetical protein
MRESVGDDGAGGRLALPVGVVADSRFALVHEQLVLVLDQQPDVFL